MKKSKNRTKSNSRLTSKHRLKSPSSQNITTPKGKRSRKHSKLNIVDSKPIRLENEDDHEEEMDGEGEYELDLAAFKLREKQEVLKLCQGMTESFWESAWAICSERFYSRTASCMIALELRDTWLRIIEAEWMDGGDDLFPDMFAPDEPPPPLLFESPSTDAFIHPRSAEASKEEVVSQLSGGGEPHVQNLDKKSLESNQSKRAKSRPKNSSSLGKKALLSKIPRKKGFKSPPMKVPTKKTGNQKRSKPSTATKISKPDSPKKEPEKPVPEIKIESPSQGQLPTDENNNDLDCIPRPQQSTPVIEDDGLPWETIFISKYKNFDADVSPSISQEYKFLGIKPWTPSQCQLENPGGVFRLSHETSTLDSSRIESRENAPPSFETSVAPPPSLSEQEMKKVKGSKKSGVKEKKDVEEPTGNLSDEVKDVVTGISLKKGSILMEPGSDESAFVQSLGIVGRIDNLLEADSDHVVDILLPMEAAAYSAGSQEFNFHNIEFVEHFGKPDEKDSKIEEKKRGEKKVRRKSKSGGGKEIPGVRDKLEKKGIKGQNIVHNSKSPVGSTGKIKSKSPRLSISPIKVKSPIEKGKRSGKSIDKSGGK